MRTIAIVLVLAMGVARADDTPTERHPVPSIRPAMRHSAIGFGIVAGLSIGVGIPMTVDPQTDGQRDGGPFVIGAGVGVAASALTMFIQSRASDPADDVEACERAHTYKVVGLATVASGIALAIGGSYVAHSVDETLGWSMEGGAFVASGIGIALVATSIEYRDAARKPIIVAPTGQGVAISGAF